MNRRLAAALPASTPLAALLAIPATANAQGLLDTFPAWSEWLGGASALLLIVALALAVGSSAKEPRYPKPRRLVPMPLNDTQGSP